MHHKVEELADSLGVELADRNASESWLYDGESIALWYQPLDFFGEGPFRINNLSDHSILHELAHYISASPEQRDLPEFGLPWGAAVHDALGPLDGTYRSKDGKILWSSDIHSDESMMSLIMDQFEENVQEIFAQQFCIYYGCKWEVSPFLDDSDPDYCCSWDNYAKNKLHENQDKCEVMNEAISRLKTYISLHTPNDQQIQ